MSVRGSRLWRFLVVFALALPLAALGAAPAVAAGAGWTLEPTSIPTPRNSLAATTGQDGWIYTFGGYAEGGGDFPGYRSDVEAFNPATGVWRCSVGDTAAGCSSSTIPAMPGGGRYLFTAVTGTDGTLYVLGGQTYTSDLATVQAYNPTTNTWTTKASMQMARSRLGAAVGLDGKIYVAGSYYGDASFEVYDPAANTWTYKANMLGGRYDPLVVAGADGKIYVIGGARTGAPGEDTTVQIYDPASNNWSYGAPAPFSRYLAGAVSAGGAIYATGGAYSETRVAMYLPGSDTWIERASFPTVTTGQVTVRGPDNRLYAIGGASSTDTGIGGAPTIYAYTPGPYARLTAPAGAGGNVPFSVTVTVRNDDGSVDAGYRGTVRFTSNDGAATLPADYTFTAGDAGAHTFSGVKLATNGARTITATDTTASEVSATATVLVDGSAPTTTINGNGYAFGAWTNGSVTVSLSASDNAGGSGVDKTYYNLDSTGQQTYAAPLTVSSEGTHTLLYWSVDAAGNAEAQRTATIKIDTTAPVVTCGSADGAWHAANVTIACSTVEGGSGLANAGYASFTLATTIGADVEASNAPTASANVCDLAGNCSPAGPIAGNMVDRKAPTVTASAKTADNNAYTAGTWTSQDVTVTFTCADFGSGLASCAPPATVSTPGANQSRTGAGSDNVGNSASATFSAINIDRAAPVTTLDAGGYAPGSWTNAAVQLTLSATDAAPGAGVTATYYTVDGGARQVYSGAAIDIASEGVHTLAFWSADAAGNVETTQTAQIMVDLTDPTFACAQPDGAWHATDVSLACTASDALSALSNPADAGFTLSTSLPNGSESSDVATGSRAICDQAGNCVTAGPLGGNQIDRAAPSIAITSPRDGATYQRKQPVTMDFACADGGAGVASCAGTVADGAALDTVTPGPHTVTVTTQDAVGNSASRTVGYTIEGNMHVEALAGYRVNCDGVTAGCLKFGARIEAQGDGVPGALVTLRISKPGDVIETVSATTDRYGSASFQTRANVSGTYTISVLDVTADYFNYAPEENGMTSRGFGIVAR